MQGPKNAVEILSGWKDIASHLGKGVRTVQRYERSLALPVRRPAGHLSGSVIATKGELDAWASAAPLQESFRLSRVREDNSTLLKGFRLAIAEMHRLRRESAELRDQLMAEFELLKRNLSFALPLADALSFDVKKKVQ